MQAPMVARSAPTTPAREPVPEQPDTPAPRSPQAPPPPPPASMKLPNELLMDPYAMDTSDRDVLLCEGFLTKLKGSSWKNKSRHFRLTESSFAYYDAHAGKLIASVPKCVLGPTPSMLSQLSQGLKVHITWCPTRRSSQFHLFSVLSLRTRCVVQARHHPCRGHRRQR